MSENQHRIEKTLDRVKKLLALASDKAASEGEASAAMARVHVLLSQHNLSLENIDLSDKNSSTDEADMTTLENQPHDKWIAQIFNGVCKLYYCEYIIGHTNVQGGRRLTYWIVGTQLNRTIAINTAEYLVKTVKDRCNIDMHGESRKHKNDYKRGASSRLYQRLIELYQNAIKQETVTESGDFLPVLASLYDKYRRENNAVVDAKIGPTKQDRPRNTKVNPSAYLAGQNTGNNISLNQQMGGSTSKAYQLH